MPLSWAILNIAFMSQSTYAKRPRPIQRKTMNIKNKKQIKFIRPNWFNVSKQIKFIRPSWFNVSKQIKFFRPSWSNGANNI